MSSRTFSIQDQLAFAELSGDWNPLHVDPVAARRLLFGGPMVHGLHAVLWAIDCWAQGGAGNAALRSIKAAFRKPIPLGVETVYSLASEKDSVVRMRVAVGGAVAAQIDCHWAACDCPIGLAPSLLYSDCGVCRLRMAGDIAAASGQMPLGVDVPLAGRMFPHLMRCLSPLQVAELLATTRLVGMECPGLHSVYAELELHFTPAESGDGLQSLQFLVQEWDERYRSVVMDVAAPGMRGTVKSFLRPEPQQQAAWEQIQDLVTPGEFRGQRALIVGGSRGLGEVTAKLLAAGGADVRITYCQGKSDADAVVREIVNGGGSAVSVCYDVRGRGQHLAGDLGPGWRPSHLYYYATPHVDGGSPGSFCRALFDKYCDYYLQGFHDAVQAVRAAAPDMKHVYCPSTVFIDELPRSMLEYVLAKASAETLCEFLEKQHRGLTIYRPRLPRLATDQTASLLPANVQDPLRVMRDSLRAFSRDRGVHNE